MELFCLGRGRGKAMAQNGKVEKTHSWREGDGRGEKPVWGSGRNGLEGNEGTGAVVGPKRPFLRFRVGKAGEMNRRSVSFTEPPKVRRSHRRHHHRHLQPSTSEEETDVDLPRHSRGPLAQHNKSSSLSIDTQMPPPPSNFPAQISPVLDPSIYDELAFCDCSLFPECALGKAIPLLDLDDRMRERKRATDLLDIIPDPPNPFAQKNQRPPSFEMGRKTTMRRQKAVLDENGGGIGGSIGCFGRRGNAFADQRYSNSNSNWNWNSNWNAPSPPPPPVPFLAHPSSSLPPPPDHLSPSRSPTPSSSNSSSSADHLNNEGEKTILFRLPLTITKAKHGRSVGECEVRERRVDGQRGHAEPVDFTEMGLFVGPPSETDPEESFVLVERRKLFAESAAESTTALPAASISPLATTTASPHHSQRQSQHPSPSAANHHQFHRGPSAENLLSIRVTESQQQAPPLLREPDLDTEDRREEEFGSGEEGVDIPSMPIGGGGGIGRNRSPHFLEGGPHPHHHPHPHSHSPLQPQSSPSSSSMKAPAGGGAVDRREDLAGIVDPQIRHIWAEAVDLSEIRNVEDQTEFRSLRAQLGIDKISSETLSQYHVKGHMDNFDQPAICYPRYRGPSARNRIPNGIKLIRRIGDKLAKENYPHETDKIRFSGMFGLHMVTQFDNRIVLCTNERDALAVYDASNGIPALSLPQGERFDQTVVPYLEDFDLIYIWFPHIHERFAKDYASYLNAARCYIITAPLRPVELVRDNRAKEVLHSIQDAVRVRYKGFRSVQDLRDSVRSEIVQSKSKLAGLTLWKRYSLLNNYLRGFRPSEMTVLSGGSHGKTTFICEYAMDLYTQGVRTLFCNFEMPEEKILKWMIIQFAGPSHVRSLARSRTFTSRSKVPLQQRQDHSSVEMWLDRFERTHSDLVIMKTEEFREKTLKEIADAIREQTLACGTQHLVIDNLQALVDMATVHIDPMTVAERTHQQDRFVGMLRRMASTQELHITLVVHPIKEPNELGYYELHHIGGPSAKITQEADNVLVIQRRRDADDRRKFRKFLYILKNRFGGRCVEVDQIEMLFQPSTLIHSLVETSR